MKSKEEELVIVIKNNKEEFYKLAYSYMKNEIDASDVIGESTYKGLKNINKLKQKQYMKSWLYRIIINECKTALKKKKRIVYDTEITDNVSTKEEKDYMDLYYAIDDLGEKHKEVIKLRYFAGMKNEEIAFATNTNVNTVKSRLKRATEMLKGYLGEDYNE